MTTLASKLHAAAFALLAAGCTAALPALAAEKTAVVYFSRADGAIAPDAADGITAASLASPGGRLGTTAAIAAAAARALSADLIALEAQESYPAKFQDVIDRNHAERGTYPGLRQLPDLSGYAHVVVGTPNWNMALPGVMETFLRDARGRADVKALSIFVTHGGYGAGSGPRAIERAFPNAALRGEVLAVSSKEAPQAQEAVKAWIASIQPEDAVPAVSQEGVRVVIRAAGREMEAVLNGTPEAEAFCAMLPLTVRMGEYGGREYYGTMNGRIRTVSEGQFTFEDGALTYCPANNSAAIFYAQSSRPTLTMAVYPVGRVVSDLSVFSELPPSAAFTFTLRED